MLSVNNCSVILWNTQLILTPDDEKLQEESETELWGKRGTFKRKRGARKCGESAQTNKWESLVPYN